MAAYGTAPQRKACPRGKEEGMASNCDSCVNYVYDEEDECFYCLVNLDEDEMYRFLTGTQNACPYYQLDDEYGVVRHQI